MSTVFVERHIEGIDGMYRSNNKVTENILLLKDLENNRMLRSVYLGGWDSPVKLLLKGCCLKKQHSHPFAYILRISSVSQAHLGLLGVTSSWVLWAHGCIRFHLEWKWLGLLWSFIHMEYFKRQQTLICKCFRFSACITFADVA